MTSLVLILGSALEKSSLEPQLSHHKLNMKTAIRSCSQSLPARVLAIACVIYAVPVLSYGTVIANEPQGPSNSTLGMVPPQEAVVLFDGANLDKWKPFSFQVINPKNDQKEIQWKLVDDGAMQIAFEFEGKKRKQFLCTKESFGDYRLHLEFRLPGDGGKGNSGLFFGPLYELQILDSSNKDEASLSDCGAIYQIRAPDKNASLGPGEWQTVDLEYQAARFGAHGSMTERNAARVTVRLNGELIHDDIKLSLRRNKYAAFPETPLTPIVLQEHGSPVKFRNIWLVENLKKDGQKK